MSSLKVWVIDYLQSWAIILAYYLSNQTFKGATHLEYALIGGLSISQALIISPIVAATHRYIGLKPTLILGSIIIFVALFTSSYATEVWQLFLSQGVLFGWGMGFIYSPASSALPPWFSTWRSLAVGISTSGAGLGGLMYSFITHASIENLGIGWTYRILAICSFSTNVLAAILLKDFHGRRHEPRPRLGFPFHDLRRIEVLLVILWGACTELGYITLLYSLPSYASSVGLTPTQGSVANAMLNLGLGLGRPLVGYFSDTFGRINMAGAMTAFCAFLCFVMWIPSQSFGTLAVFALLVGGVCGIFWATITPVLVEVVGLSRLTSTFGVICLSMVLPTTFAEPVAMQVVDSTNQSFLGAQIFVACAFVTGALCLLLLRSWKIVASETSLPRGSSNISSNPAGAHHGWSWLLPRAIFALRRV